MHGALSLSERLFHIFENEIAAYTYAAVFGVLVLMVQMFHGTVVTKTRMEHEQTHKDMRKSVDEFYEREKVRRNFFTRCFVPLFVFKISTAVCG